MTDALEVFGLACIATAGFLVTLWLGFAVVGAGCLWVSWSLTHKAEKKKAGK